MLNTFSYLSVVLMINNNGNSVQKYKIPLKLPNFFDKSCFLLSAETGEVGGNIVPGLEGVAAKLDMRRHS